MKIHHNIAAINTMNSRKKHTTDITGTIQKLSSGYKINRASDDAAGLAISEKMRGQIRGLSIASKNAQDGISLIQTTEGALGETHAMLQRMRELTIQAANDINTDEDRHHLQKEIDTLIEEVDRVAQTTEFNTMKTLNGTILTNNRKVVLQVGANSAQQMAMALNGDATAKGLQLIGEKTVTPEIIRHSDVTLGIDIGAGYGFANSTDAGFPVNMQLNKTTNTLEIFGNASFSHSLINEPNIPFYMSVANGESIYNELEAIRKKTSYSISTSSLQLLDAAIKQSIQQPNDPVAKITASAKFQIYDVNEGTDDPPYMIAEVVFRFDYDKKVAVTYNEQRQGYESLGYFVAAEKLTTENYTESAAQSIFQQFRNMDLANNGNRSVFAELQALSTTTPEIIPSSETSLGGVNVTSQQRANDSLQVIDSAIAIVSNMRAQLGAYYNRLEHTIANVSNSAENITEAESRIRDTDMASMMMQYTKQQLLMQASTAMLGQANQHSSLVLQLLA